MCGLRETERGIEKETENLASGEQTLTPHKLHILVQFDSIFIFSGSQIYSAALHPGRSLTGAQGL